MKQIIYVKSKDRYEIWTQYKDKYGKLHRNRVTFSVAIRREHDLNGLIDYVDNHLVKNHVRFFEGKEFEISAEQPESCTEKDIVKKNSIKNVLLLERIIKYTLLNLGNVTSSKNLCKYLKKDCKKTTPTTVLDYLKILEESKLFYSVHRYDIAKDRPLKTLPKYYIGDIGINNAIMGFNGDIEENILENLVFLELLHRNCEIMIGKYNNREISFVVKTPETRKYYQICKTIGDTENLCKKCESLELIKDNYEKIVLTLDKDVKKEWKGIKFINIIDFLLEEY